MLKVIFLLIIAVSSTFAGWFSTPTKTEFIEVNGEKVRIVFNYETNETKFQDTFSVKRNNEVYYQDLRKRGNEVFSLIKDYGKEKGFKSFSIQAKFLAQETGFIMDNTEDIVKYCTLGKNYTSFCSAGENGIIFSEGRRFAIKVIFYTDNSGSISF